MKKATPLWNNCGMMPWWTKSSQILRRTWLWKSKKLLKKCISWQLCSHGPEETWFYHWKLLKKIRWRFDWRIAHLDLEQNVFEKRETPITKWNLLGNLVVSWKLCKQVNIFFDCLKAFSEKNTVWWDIDARSQTGKFVFDFRKKITNFVFFGLCGLSQNLWQMRN